MQQSIKTFEEKKKDVQASIIQKLKQASDLRRYVHRLYKQTEKAMNSLFPNVHITIVGAIQAL